MGRLDSIISDDVTVPFFDWGNVATYTPWNDYDVDPFAITVIVGSQLYDEIERHFVRDVIECRIAHADLVAHGVDSPTTRTHKSEGDTLAMPDQNGDSQTWSIVEKRYEHGLWVLTLERNLRVTS